MLASGLSSTRRGGSERFTAHGSDVLEQHLARTCERVAAAIGGVIPLHRLDAVVLGGGYGRGQGGVLKTESGDRPYNDLEFYVFTRGSRLLDAWHYKRPLDEIAEQLSPEAGLHVEFKLDSLEYLRRSPVTMFSYDLASGHRIILGSEGCFAGCEHHLDPTKIPLSEATRLLFNRGSGLLLAEDLLRHAGLDEEQADFIGRNLAKAQLALGDVALTVFGQYHWDCAERCRRLAALVKTKQVPRAAEIVEHHAAGARFKLHPQRVRKTRESFEQEHGAISSLARGLWLWLESLRLDRSFASAREYAFSSVNKAAESRPARNLLLTVRTFGPGAMFDRRGVRYPRERLFNSLCLLLWDDSRDAEVLRCLQRELRTKATDWRGLLHAYERIWSNFG